MTTKENAAVSFLLSAAGLTLHFLLRHNRKLAVLTASCAAAAVLAYMLILSSLFGGFHNSLELVREYAHYSGMNPYSLQFDSGPVWMIPAGLFRTSPFLFIAGLTGFIGVLFRTFGARSLRNAGLPLGIALLTFSVLSLQVLTHRYSFRYFAPAFAPFCLLAGIGVEAPIPFLRRLLDPLGRRAAYAILGFAVSVAALRDFNAAFDNFLRPGLQDLALRPVVGVPPAAISPEDSH